MTIAPFRRLHSSKRVVTVAAASLCLASAVAFAAAAESYFWLGLPVAFANKEYAFHSGFAIELTKVTLQTTQPIELKKVWLSPDWGAWMSDFNTNRLRASIDELHTTPAALARLGTSDGPSSRKITHVNFGRLTLDVGGGQLNLPAGEMVFNGDGTLNSVQTKIDDKLAVTISPSAGKLAIAVQTERFPMKLLPAFAFENIVARGQIDEEGLLFDKIGASAEGGSIEGTVRVSMLKGYELQGDLTLNSLRARDVLAHLYPRHVIEGLLSGNVKIKASGETLEALLAAPVQVEGQYTLKAGSIDRFGLLEGMRRSDPGVVGGGLVRFEHISGKFAGATGSKATASFTGLNNGALQGSGNFAVSPEGDLSGSVGGTLKLPGGEVVSRNLALTGKVSAPILTVRR